MLKEAKRVFKDKGLVMSYRTLAGSILILASIYAFGGDWPQFRGTDRSNVSSETGLFRKWPAEGPKVVWKTPVCQGYAGAAIKDGRVYVNDYNADKKEHLVRCISLATGKDLWQWSYPVDIRPSHGITRTVPAIGQTLVFSLDPKCRFHALDAKTGKLVWEIDLVKEYKADIPNWYAGQNPLIDGNRVILAIGGDTALIIAFDQATGKEVWRTPNPGKEELMSHSSLMPATIGGVKQFLYVTMKNLMGIAATDGKLLWKAPFSGKMVVVPSPISIGDGRIFVTSGYKAGSAMYQVEKSGAGFTARKLYSLDWKEFGSEAHTPVLFQNHLFAVSSKNDKGRFTCLGLDGKVVWESPLVRDGTFGLGGFLLADGMFFILDGDSGKLRLLEANTKEYKELASAQILSEGDVWGPMALSNGKLIVRDMNRMMCLQVGPSGGVKK
jgi:outer membrane protein assembly factor BamB